MLRTIPGAALIALCLSTAPASARQHPDFSGVWRLDPAQSRMIGGTPTEESGYQLTWLVDHRDPRIAVVVNVRDERGSTEYSFACTTDGQRCVNELPSLGEVRHMTAWWDGSVLRMSQQVTAPGGGFTASDRLYLAEAGEQLVFERVVTNASGDRPVRQVFRKLGPHPSQRPAPEPLPSVELPPELARVLRDYERHWGCGTDPGIPDRGMFILTLRRGEGGRWLIAADLDGAIRS